MRVREEGLNGDIAPRGKLITAVVDASSLISRFHVEVPKQAPKVVKLASINHAGVRKNQLVGSSSASG
ncbi:hypothetical protein M501DRAFT_1017291 [Patellaria atrata CBS 101060]|uniref:Uncharacterized protein n=1 Tax=Patellaria atrata CBS 101060 TaxID=1346257 RepID=A0A9P4S8Z5_9PEZI|nr:hypothetical protein M501DRAFT_1017291 [Patellaria atrata CBS 101060]